MIFFWPCAIYFHCNLFLIGLASYYKIILLWYWWFNYTWVIESPLNKCAKGFLNAMLLHPMNNCLIIHKWRVLILSTYFLITGEFLEDCLVSIPYCFSKKAFDLINSEKNIFYNNQFSRNMSYMVCIKRLMGISNENSPKWVL